MLTVYVMRYVVDFSLWVGLWHLVFHPKRLTAFEALASTWAWSLVSLLAYYMIGHQHLIECTWLWAAALGQLYILDFCIETLASRDLHNR